MFESFGFETLTAPQAAVYLALALGIAFGAQAERVRFCLRRALVGEDRRQALGVWLMALATAVAGTQAAVALGLLSFADHRFLSADLPWLAIVTGGALFGAGMVLTRGCVSRLTVLSATGNLRALLVLAVFAITAHAALKGALAPLVGSLTSVRLALPAGGLDALPGGAAVWTAALVVPALAVALSSGNRAGALLGGTLIGALVPLGWVGTGVVLQDDFDPVAMQSLAFSAPWADALFYTVAASAVPANFGAGLIAGVLLGAFLSAAAGGRLGWQSFTSPAETGRYLAGAVMMGLGGVLAGGCTVGAGLTGLSTLGLSAVLALGAIAVGALVMTAAINAPRGLMGLQPAE